MIAVREKQRPKGGSRYTGYNDIPPAYAAQGKDYG